MYKVLVQVIFTIIFFTQCSSKNMQVYTGTASFYHNKFNGRKTAIGTKFDNNGLTCACNRIKLGTWVKVTNIKNNKSIDLQVTDRLAATNKRIVDVTQKAAHQLGFYNAGLAKVKVEIIKKNVPLNHHKNKLKNNSVLETDTTN